MKGIYLAACKARHPNYDIDYQDIDTKYKCDISGDMMDVDLINYDYLIATPPCNWWSKANPYYKTSEYALSTKHLLPDILVKFALTNKPFIVENVKNIKRMRENGIFDICDKYNINVYIVGRHTYFTNLYIGLLCPQHQDFMYGGKRVNNDGYNQGGSNVKAVIDIWLKIVNE